ncbi:MAG: dihydropteroate synthase [Rhodospirillales bacterium]|nr:dihydropteroate synthase [Rhodospirillales bacterium]
MGILNVTPDSFSDGGCHFAPDRAIEAGLAMAAAGAAMVDVGGESTRPGAGPVAPDEEQARVLPVIRALARRGVVVSVDTRNATTMQAALSAGAQIINDISALTHDPAALALVARAECGVVLMHMRGTPATMGQLANYDDVVGEVRAELADRLAIAEAAGIDRSRIALDPGIGFAKSRPQNLGLLRGLPRLSDLGCKLVVGVSRKRFIGSISGVDAPAGRLAGSLAAGLFAISRGAAVLRVHDVAETVQALRVWRELTALG